MPKKPTLEELKQRVKELEEETSKSKRAYETLRESEERHKKVFEEAQDGIFLGDAKTGILVDCNPAGARLVGRDRSELIGQHQKILHPPREINGDFSETFEKHLEEYDGQVLETQVITSTGEIKEVAIKSNLLHIGERTFLQAIFRDISDRKHMEEKLRESEKKYRLLAENSHDVIWTMDMNLAFTYMSPSCKRIIGYSAEELMTKPIEEILTPSSYESAMNILSEELGLEQSGKEYDPTRARMFEIEHVRKDGSTVWVEISATFLRDNDGRPVEIQAITREITERRRIEDALRDSEQKLAIKNKIANIFLTVPDEKMFEEVLEVVLEAIKSRYGIFGYIDEDGTWVCPSLTRDIWDQCQMPGKDIKFPRDTWAGMWGKALLEKTPLYSNEAFQVPEGHIAIHGALDVPIIHRGELIGNLLVGNKETGYTEEDKEFLEALSEYIAPVLHARLQRDREEKERKDLEFQLRQAQRIESIGTLAGGIAHDFNNILYAIMGNTEMTIDDVPEDSPARAGLNEILKAANRARDLVQQILAFSKPSERERRPLKVQPILKEALQFLRSSLPTTIEIRQDIDMECGPILGDPSQVHQIIMNLCTNAFHAMREKGGKMYLTLASHHDPETGPCLRLTVSDTGHGMDSQIMERIFDPFFTSKPPGEGTGLGLSMVHGIVKSYGGRITVDSDPGKGSKFDVYLPVIEREAMAPEAMPTEEVPHGKENVLLVDDEEQIVRMIAPMLERFGYHVTFRTSSVEALEAFRAMPDRFDIVVTDQTMPNMTGEDLAMELVNIRPDIPIILCTGFSETITEQKAKAVGIREFVMKPILVKKLARTIRRVLDG